MQWRGVRCIAARALVAIGLAQIKKLLGIPCSTSGVVYNNGLVLSRDFAKRFMQNVCVDGGKFAKGGSDGSGSTCACPDALLSNQRAQVLERGLEERDRQL